MSSKMASEIMASEIMASEGMASKLHGEKDGLRKSQPAPSPSASKIPMEDAVRFFILHL